MHLHILVLRCEQVLRQHPGDDWLQAVYMVEDVLGRVHPSHCRWGVLVQRRTNGSPHNGRLCVPRLGSGSGLAHGAVLHGSHTRIHDLHVPWAQGDLQRATSDNASASRGYKASGEWT